MRLLLDHQVDPSRMEAQVSRYGYFFINLFVFIKIRSLILPLLWPPLRLQCCCGRELHRISSKHTQPVTKQPAIIAQFFNQSAVSHLPKKKIHQTWTLKVLSHQTQFTRRLVSILSQWYRHKLRQSKVLRRDLSDGCGAEVWPQLGWATRR